jgi:hypothetical protein
MLGSNLIVLYYVKKYPPDGGRKQRYGKFGLMIHRDNCHGSLRGCLESIKQVIFILGNREQGTGNRE